MTNIKKLKEYRKLKNQKKLTEKEVFEIYESITSTKEMILFVNSILNFQTFKIKAEFLIKTATKNGEKYKTNGNYEKYEKENFYTNGHNGYSTKKIGYLKLIKSEILKYKFQDEDSENFDMIKVIEFQKI